LNYPVKMDFQFDKHGLITPKEIIELSLGDFERIFVKERTEKKHRQRIFKEYLQHNKQIQKEIGTILFQFVNGSFTTLKAKPNDIDVVSFIDYRIYRKKEEEILQLEEYFDKFDKLDIHIIPRSYPGHPGFIEIQLMYEYWKALFSRTREMNRKRLSKGLIKINFYE